MKDFKQEKIEEALKTINKASKQLQYNYEVIARDIIFLCGVDTITKNILHVRNFETMDELYLYIEGVELGLSLI